MSYAKGMFLQKDVKVYLQLPLVNLLSLAQTCYMGNTSSQNFTLGEIWAEKTKMSPFCLTKCSIMHVLVLKSE